jgi:hypothetical protein
MSAEPGYDGNPPIAVELRDLPGLKGKRALRRGQITGPQCEAANKLEGDNYLALRVALSSPSKGCRSGGSFDGITTTMIDAAARVRAAQRFVEDNSGPASWHGVYQAVLCAAPWELVARRLRVAKQKGINTTRDGLTDLARFYGIIS